MGLNSRITTRIMKQFLIVPALLCSSSAQLKFGGSQSSSGSKGGQKASNGNPNTDTRFFTGNEALDGGILGLGAGLLGGAVLGGVLNGGNGGNGCGRRRRQADGTNTWVLGALLGGGSGGCNCGRRKRQAPGEDKPGTRFFGLDGLLGGGSNNNCCNCGYNSGYNNGYNNGVNNGGSNGFNSGFNNPQPSNRCQCNYNLTFQDKYGDTHGACRRADETGRRWCYTTGYGCSDARQSQRFPNNPWSYQACSTQG